MITDKYSTRQVCALTTTALSAPLVTVCASVSWQWVLLAIAAVGLYNIYIVWALRNVPAYFGYGKLLRTAFGKVGGVVVLVLYWLWLVLSLGKTARESAIAFPQDQAIPLIPLILMALALLVAYKGVGAACRFGGTLFLCVFALLGFVLLFSSADVELHNLKPSGKVQDAIGPGTLLLLSGGALFFRDKVDRRDTSYLKWGLLLGGLALVSSLACIGTLGAPLASAADHAFWLMSRSISVFGIMERFEAAISALLAMGYCCLLVFFLSQCGKCVHAMTESVGERVGICAAAVLGFAALWLVPHLPLWIWRAGNGLFWGAIPILTLEVVRGKINS